MKRIILPLIALLTLGACSQSDELGSSDKDNKGKMTFTATTEGESRAYVDADGTSVKWNANDKISVFAGNTACSEFTFGGNDGDFNGTFTGTGATTGSDIANNYAIYPYAEGNTIDANGVITTTLPATQTYKVGSFGSGANTMVAVTNGTDDKNLKFKNVCGYLKLKLYGTGVTVKKIVLRGISTKTDEITKIAGAAKVTAANDGEPTVAMQDGATEFITLDCGTEGVAIGATSDAATEFWLAVPPVSFTKGIVVTITNTDGLTMSMPTSTERTIERNKVTSMKPFEVSFVHAYVDLGLPSGTLWATTNIGANKAEDHGDYFAWGETTGYNSDKSFFYWSKYKYGTSSINLTKYNNDSNYGTVDSKTVLESEDDAATANWGDNWRMPTKEEWDELLNTENCSRDEATVNGVKGFKFTSKKEGYTNNSLFLPDAGIRDEDGLYDDGEYGYFWSASLISVDPSSAYYLTFNSSDASIGYNLRRYFGLSVRPVHKN